MLAKESVCGWLDLGIGIWDGGVTEDVGDVVGGDVLGLVVAAVDALVMDG